MLDKKNLLIFPTSRAIREYLFSLKEKDTLLPSTLSIDEFLKKAIYLDEHKYIQEEQRIIFLFEAIKNIDIKNLGISSTFTNFLKESEYIYRFFLELSSEKVNIEDLSKVDTYEFYGEHLEILKAIYKNYLNILEKNLYIDRVNLDKVYTLNKNFIKRFNDITLIYEGYLTKQEFEIIKKVSKYTKVFIKFYSNIYNQKSLELFKDFSYEFKLDYEYLVDLSNLEVIEENKTKILREDLQIKGFSSRFNQVAYIKATISALVSNGVNPQNIALVLPDEDFSQVLQLNDEEKYFNFAMGKNILNKNLFQVMSSIYSYINSEDIQDIEALRYFLIDKNFVDSKIKDKWNKNITKDSFSEISKFLRSYEKDEELLEKFDDLSYRLNLVFFTDEYKLKLKEVYKIFLQELSKISLDDAHSGKITVMGLLETRAIKFDAVIICDFNSSFIPKISIKDKFLSSKVKALASLPTRLDRENLQKYYYKRLFDNSKQVFISYVNSSEDEISKFAYELFGNIKISSNDATYKDILYKSKKLKSLDEEIIDSIDFTKIKWSASSLKTFLECKRTWYLKYILGLKEHSISRLPKAFELGTIIHKILEDFYKIPNNDIRSLYELFLKYRSDNPFLSLDLEVYREKLKNFLIFDKSRLKNGQIIELEKNFCISFKDFTLTGVIDRIDKFGDSYELIDYKTSRTLKLDTLKTYEKSCDFQLEFYFLAIKELYKTNNIKAYYYDIFRNSLEEEVVLFEKLKRLEDIFEDIKKQSNKEIIFSKGENKSSLEYSPYKVLCDLE